MYCRYVHVGQHEFSIYICLIYFYKKRKKNLKIEFTLIKQETENLIIVDYFKIILVECKIFLPPS